MGSIKIGIQENVNFSKVVKDENGNVELHLTQGVAQDALAALTGNGVIGGADASKVLIWALKAEAFGGKITGKPLVEHINAYRAFFNEILEQFYPANQIDWSGVFAGTKVKTGEDIETLSDAEVAVVGNNITDVFVKMMANSVAAGKRIKFYRQNASKNFVSLKPEMFTKFGKVDTTTGFRRTWTVPFIEDMSIPKEASKLSYDLFERGYRNGATPENGGVPTGLDVSNPNQAVADTTPASVDDLPFTI